MHGPGRPVRGDEKACAAQSFARFGLRKREGRSRNIANCAPGRPRLACSGALYAVAVQERDPLDSRRAGLNSDDDFGDANEVAYYHSNTLASVYALSDGNESVIERCCYDAAVCPERSRRGACTVLGADGEVRLRSDG